MPTINDLGPRSFDDTVWVEAYPGLHLCLRPLSNRQFQQAVQRKTRAKRRSLKNRDLTVREADQVMIDCIPGNILCDWKGLDNENGVAIPYSDANAKGLLQESQSFLDLVQELAGDHNLFGTPTNEDGDTDPEVLGKSSSGT